MVVCGVVLVGITKLEEGPSDFLRYVFTIDHDKATKGWHVSNDVIDISKVPTLRADSIEVFLKAVPVGSCTLEGSYRAVCIEVGLDSEVEV